MEFHLYQEESLFLWVWFGFLCCFFTTSLKGFAVGADACAALCCPGRWEPGWGQGLLVGDSTLKEVSGLVVLRFVLELVNQDLAW